MIWLLNVEILCVTDLMNWVPYPAPGEKDCCSLFDIETMAAQELIQNTVEIIDSAHSYRLELSQLLDTLTELEEQV